MLQKVERTKSEKKRFTQFVKHIRMAFKFTDKYVKAIEDVVSEEVGSRGGKRYDCLICNSTLPVTSFEVDHYPEGVTPDGMTRVSMREEDFIERVMKLPVRAICKDCHKAHTQEQMQRKRELKKKAKEAK